MRLDTLACRSTAANADSSFADEFIKFSVDVTAEDRVTDISSCGGRCSPSMIASPPWSSLARIVLATKPSVAIAPDADLGDMAGDDAARTSSTLATCSRMGDRGTGIRGENIFVGEED